LKHNRFFFFSGTQLLFMMSDLYIKNEERTINSNSNQNPADAIVKQNIQTVFLQLTRGCGKPNCPNEYCCNNKSKFQCCLGQKCLIFFFFWSHFQ